jgi:hypothetical protein
MANRRLPPVENLDDILKEVEVIPTNCNNFVSAVTSHNDSFKNKAVSYHINKVLKASQEEIRLNGEENEKWYFEVEMSRDGDIISHIDLGCSTATSSLKVGSKLCNSNKRVVHCASIYTPIYLIITLSHEHNLDDPIFLSWKTTVLLDTEVRNRVFHANLKCDGIRYLNGMALII